MLHTPIKFVAFNTNEQILRILVRILKRGASWECSGIAQIEQVQSALEGKPDVLVIGVGGREQYVAQWTNYCESHNIHIIHHYGGGSGLLFNSIQAYLDQREQSS